VLVPADRPNEILLVTNFGLVLSEDGGRSWLWSCEQAANAFGFLYQLGPPPRHRLFALANDALVFSDDGTCGWQVAGGALTGAAVSDAFADPTNADHVLAVASSGGASSVFASRDGGATFDATPLYAPASGTPINGVEIARADPQTIYVALGDARAGPGLARSRDGGAHWTVSDLGGALGAGALRIVAVDAQNPDRVWLRFSGTSSEALALTTDGGATAAVALPVSGTLTSFAALPSGTLFASANVNPNAVATLYRSRDGGGTFAVVPSAPSVRALAARGADLYAAADNFGNGYALGVSSDEGDSWHAAMSYGQVEAIVPCLKSSCQTTCAAQVGAGLWTDPVCSADPPPATGGPDASAPPDAGAPPDAAIGAGGTGGSSKGCGCALGAPTGASASGAVLLLCLLAAARRRPTRRPPAVSARCR
jgi:hypothetical protein